jgi:hypothetical protein
VFELRLCLALGKTLQELRDGTTAEELRLWHAYELTQGLPTGRIEAAVALAGAAACQTWGARVKPIDLIPRYEDVTPLSYRDGAAIFAAYAEAHNQRCNGKTT